MCNQPNIAAVQTELEEVMYVSERYDFVSMLLGVTHTNAHCHGRALVISKRDISWSTTPKAC